jgi:hypothetical protein
MYSTERLAEAVTALAGRVAEPEARAQLYALGGILRNIALEPPDRDARSALERAVVGAMRDGDEAAAIAAMRRLAALDRAPLQPVDWSAASGG